MRDVVYGDMHMTTISVRLDDETTARLDRVAEALAGRVAGARLSRSDAIRVALLRALDSLEDELGISKPKKKR
jgi:Arc/MetJ-type ribon-helix-helix transcriptional regulator